MRMMGHKKNSTKIPLAVFSILFLAAIAQRFIFPLRLFLDESSLDDIIIGSSSDPTTVTSDDRFVIITHPPPTTLSRLTKNHHNNNSTIFRDSTCHHESSLLDYAIELANSFGPPHSVSWNKTRHVLSLSTTFHIQLHAPIFNSVANNIAKLLIGYGLTQTHSRQVNGDRLEEPVIIVENSYFAALKNMTSCTGRYCQEFPRIIIQSEQPRTGLNDYLIACDRSPHCIILEFSEYNYQRFHHASNSILLLPVMLQNRLDNLAPVRPKPLEERKYDLVHFGLMTTRRKQFLSALQTNASAATTSTTWNVLMKTEIQPEVIAQAYQEAKICLIIHSGHETSAAEYHRLSDFAPFGCVPVVETFQETIGRDMFASCVGVIQSPLDRMVETVVHVLEHRLHFEDLLDRVEWWRRRGVPWEKLLTILLSPDKKKP